MISYQREQLASDRIRTMLHEAEQERLARRASAAWPASPSWRDRVALAIGRRLERFARSAAAS